MYNTTTASEAIGCSIATVSRWAHKLHLGKRVGAAIILTEPEVEKIREAWHGRSGNPNFGKQKHGSK